MARRRRIPPETKPAWPLPLPYSLWFLDLSERMEQAEQGVIRSILIDDTTILAPVRRWPTPIKREDKHPNDAAKSSILAGFTHQIKMGCSRVLDYLLGGCMVLKP